MIRKLVLLSSLFFVCSAIAGPIKISRDIDPKDTSTDYSKVVVQSRTKPIKEYIMPRGTDSITVDVPYSSCTKYTIFNVDNDTGEVAEARTIPEFRVQYDKPVLCK